MSATKRSTPEERALDAYVLIDARKTATGA